MLVVARRLRTASSFAVRPFKVYTRTGDEGSSSLFNGQRRQKDDAVFAALGDSDELNGAIGLARAHCAVESGNGAAHVIPHLESIQSSLLDLGSAIATPLKQSTAEQLSRAAFDNSGERTTQLEEWMDAMDVELPPLRNFILPGGSLASASLHSARSVCRRAERSLVPLVLDGECDPGVARYVNRLSDYLFVAARFVAASSGGGDIVYKKPKDRR